MRLRVALLAVTAVAMLAGVSPARAAVDHPVLMSMFRFCPTRPFPCDPADMDYVGGTDNKPLVEQYNPIPVVNVKAGDTITWTYDEPLCSAGVFCPPHTVTFADGSFGSADAKTQGATIVFTVPEGLTPGVHAYFCKYHAAVGMNGSFVVA